VFQGGREEETFRTGKVLELEISTFNIKEGSPKGSDRGVPRKGKKSGPGASKGADWEGEGD